MNDKWGHKEVRPVALCNIKKAAEQLEVSERHIRRMIAEGCWPYYRLGRQMIRVDVAEIKSLGRLVAGGKPFPESGAQHEVS